MSKIAAFFDVDGTIFRDSLLIEHFKLMIQYQILNNSSWTNEIEQKYIDWSNRKGDYDIYLEEISSQYMKVLKELDNNDVEYIANKVIKLKGDRVYRYTRNALNYHKEKGHIVIIISGSPYFLVEKMAKKLDVELFSATKYIKKNDIYTGNVIPMWDSNSKMEEINKYVKKYDIDLNKSFAYGDTTGDYSMLNLVGNPIAMNPNKRLLEKIKENEKLYNKIKIIVERKDLIYELNSNNLKLGGIINDTNK